MFGFSKLYVSHAIGGDVVNFYWGVGDTYHFGYTMVLTFSEKMPMIVWFAFKKTLY